jgi:hypothetical protein
LCAIYPVAPAHPLGNNYSGEKMKRYISILLVVTTVSAIAQMKSNELVNKIIRLTPALSPELIRLDSIYLSAMNHGFNKCAFPNKQDTVMICYKKFLEAMYKELEKNNFKWQNETKVSMRWFFNENGNIDYFFYSVNDSSFVQYKEFEDSLRNFVTNYKFGLRSDNKYSTCGSMIFGRKK